MPLPSSNDVRAVSPVLTNVSIAFQQSATEFIADQILPPVMTDGRTGTYYIWDNDDWNRDDAKLRSPGTPAARGDAALSTGTYSVDEYSYAFELSDQVDANANAGLDMSLAATQLVTNKVLIRKENIVLDFIFTTSQWTGSLTAGDITPGTKWDAAAGVPIKDVADQAQSIRAKTGRRPNTFVVGSLTHQAILGNADVIDRVKYTKAATPKEIEQALAAMFRVDKYLVSEATNTTSAEGATAATASIADADGAWLGYVAPAASILAPSAAYNMVWRNLYGGAGSNGSRIKQYRDEKLSVDVTEMSVFMTPELTSANSGVLFLATDS